MSRTTSFISQTTRCHNTSLLGQTIKEKSQHLRNPAGLTASNHGTSGLPSPVQTNNTYANDSRAAIQSALFNFQSLLLVILLLICTCAYVHDMFPSVLDRKKDGPMGVFWKCARIGERLSPYISICCVGMAVSWEQMDLSLFPFDFPVCPCDIADLL